MHLIRTSATLNLLFEHCTNVLAEVLVQQAPADLALHINNINPDSKG
jgi:hypothetical protein